MGRCQRSLQIRGLEGGGADLREVAPENKEEREGWVRKNYVGCRRRAGQGVGHEC